MSKSLTQMLALSLVFFSSLAFGADLGDLLDPGSKVRKIVGDCVFTEGPAWHPEGYLLFSDIPNNRIVRWKPDGTVDDFLKPSGKSNGLIFSSDGRLFACQHEARQVAIFGAGGQLETLANFYDDKKLNSPNDLALDNHGGLYFTDPRYGEGAGPIEQPVMGVYYYDASGKVTRIIDDLERPNGILVSPDGKHLYVAEPNKRELYRYKIEKAGIISDKKLIFTGDEELDGGGPDGMAHDVHGNIYATYQDVVVLNPEGKLIGRIPVDENTSNCAFGGKDNKTLFITARTSVYAVDLKVAGMSFRDRPGPAPAGKLVKLITENLELEIPRAWKKVKPRYKFFLHQFEIEPVVGDKEPAILTVTVFGGIQGGYGQTAYRWLGRFTPQDVKHKIYRGKCAQGDYYIVDIYGSYHRRGNVKPILTARKLGVMIQRPDGLYFVEMVGYRDTVSAEEDELRKSFGADRATEVEVKREDI